MFLHFLQVSKGECKILRSPVQGGSCESISKFLSSITSYNHPSYFKSGEINSLKYHPSLLLVGDCYTFYTKKSMYTLETQCICNEMRICAFQLNCLLIGYPMCYNYLKQLLFPRRKKNAMVSHRGSS